MSFVHIVSNGKRVTLCLYNYAYMCVQGCIDFVDFLPLFFMHNNIISLAGFIAIQHNNLIQFIGIRFWIQTPMHISNLNGQIITLSIYTQYTHYQKCFPLFTWDKTIETCFVGIPVNFKDKICWKFRARWKCRKNCGNFVAVAKNPKNVFDTKREPVCGI